MNTKEYEMRMVAKVFYNHDFFVDDMPCDSVYDTLVEIFSAFSLDRQEKIRTICQQMKVAGIKKD